MSRKAGKPPRASELPAAFSKRIDPKIATVLLAAARRNYPKRLAADLAGIARTTLYAWLSDPDPECVAFAIEYRKAMADGAGELIDTVANGNGKYAGDPKYLLGTVHRFKEQQRVELTGKHGGAILVAAQHTDAQLEAELERRGFARLKP